MQLENVITLNFPLPKKLIVGKGNAIFISGQFEEKNFTFNDMSFSADGKSFPLFKNWFPELYNHIKITRNFFSIISFSEIDQEKTVTISLNAKLKDGTRKSIDLGEIQLLPDVSISNDFQFPFAQDQTEPACVIVSRLPEMFNRGLFTQHIDSILAQEHTNWIYTIFSDLRDTGAENEVADYLAAYPNINFFKNTAKIPTNSYKQQQTFLANIPPEVPFVALSDLNTIWQPDKLKNQIQDLKSNSSAKLSYCALHSAGENKLTEIQYLQGDSGDTKKFLQFIFAPSPQPSSIIFRTELIPHILPIPNLIQENDSTHWILNVANIFGQISVIERPLGKIEMVTASKSHEYNASRIIKDALLWSSLFTIRRVYLSSIWHRMSEITWLARYLFLFPAVLLLRSKNAARPEITAELEKITLKKYPLAQIINLAISDPNKDIQSNAYKTLNILMAVSMGKFIVKVFRIFKESSILKPFTTLIRNILSKFRSEKTFAQSFVTAENIRQKMEPLRLLISDDEPRRVNVIISVINFKYFFGGYISVFNLAQKISEAGFNVRMVIVDECNFRPIEWKHEIKQYQGLEDFFDKIEVSYNFNRARSLPVSPQDQFVSISAWTAYIAHEAATQLGRERFVYLTQEYEPLFHDAGSIYNIVNGSYYLPHYAIYSTELYREYARNNKIGNYFNQNGDELSVAIENAIYPSKITKEMLEERDQQPFKLLCYARPEPHARRNMFIMLIMALQDALKSGVFDLSKWKFYGIGTVDHAGEKIEIIPGAYLELLPRVDLNTYLDILPNYDLGLSLMSSPHPSLPPLDMAAAGLITVTNTFANKTTEKLSQITSNLIPVEPNIKGIVEGLRQGVSKIENIESRIAGANINWARDWNQALNPEVMKKIVSFINEDTNLS